EFISFKTQELQLLEEDNNDKNNIESYKSVVVINPIVTKHCEHPPKQ
ncbi:15141_t:CDS:1, partial [Cetraspora pellucida]